MADVKISDLVSANVVNKNDLFLLVQDDSSKNVSAGTLFSSITDPTLSGNIFFGGPVQSLTGIGTVSITTTRTDLYGGVSANTTAIANGSVLPSTIYLYTDGKSASGRGLQFQDGTPFLKTIYVQHVNGKINLSLGANAFGALNHAPESWVGPTGLRPFDTGLHFVKGSAYTFDVSHPTNAGNIIGLSTSIDGTNTLGLEYTPGVVRTGNPGNTGATVVFTPANVSIDPGGKNYLDIPRGVDGQLKVINLVSTNGGQFVISSNIQNNLAIELRKAGDSAFLMYSGNAWILVGSNPGLQTSFSGTSDDIPEGQKLYFTNARARAAISVPDNTLIYNATTGSIRANVLALSNINLGNIIPNSDSVPEGSVNLYYSNARVHANLRLASIDALADVDTATITPQAGYGLIWNGTKWIPNVITATSFSGTLNFANTAATANTVLSLSNFTTANLAEGTNLYYTNARVYSNLALASINALADVDTLTTPPSSGQTLAWNGTAWIPTTVSASNANTANQANVANTVSSLSNFTTSNLAEGSNLYYTNARVYANVIGLLNAKANVVDLTTANVIETSGNLYFTNARVYANVIGLLSVKANVVDLTTANVAELNNLYYTNARVYSNLSLASINVLADVDTLTSPPSSGQALGWNGTAWIPTTVSASNANTATQANAVLSISNFTTSNLAEGSNLYYTNARVNAQVESNLRLKANVVDLTTANVRESASNLYYTNARVYANVTERFGSINTDLLPEGNEIQNLGSPTHKWKDLYLSGFSLSLGNTTITSGAGGALAVEGLTSNSNVITKSITSNIWNNIYTANVIESNSNLYYTNARVRSTLSNSTGVYYDKVTGAISIGQNVDTTSNVTFGALNVYGPTNFYGNVTTHSSNNLSISDNMIYLNFSSETSNPDLGFAGNYNDGTYRHAGFFRDASDAGTWKVYDNYSPEPDANIFINTDHASFRLANIAATNVTANLVGNVTGYVSTISNFSTTNLAEGTQLYYTNARVNAQVASNLALKANVVDLTTANVVELPTNLYYSNARVLANVSQMSINVFADVDISNIAVNGTLIWNGTSFIAGVATSSQSSNTSATSNVANTVLSISNFTTSNLAEGTNLYFTNARVSTALTTSNLNIGNLSVTGTLTSRANLGLTLGTASQGNLISNAITMTVDTTVTNGIAQLNEILGKLVPASPSLFPGNGFIVVNTLSSYRMANFIQTDNTSSARNVGPANTVSVVRRANSYTTTSINDKGPGDSGTLTLYKNGASAGSKTFAVGSDNGTYGELVIADNVDYSTKTGQAGGFWESFDASASGNVLAGWNEIYINHSQGGSSNVAFWYYDSSSPGAVAFSVPAIYPTSNTLANSSTVPHYTSATVFTMTANVKNLSGDMYPTSNAFITGTSATGFGTPSSLNYESAGVTGVPLPLTRNLYVTTGNAQISTTVNISSGFGSTATAPSLTGQNSYTAGTGTFTLGSTVLYKTPTVSSLTTMEESNIFVQANVGSGSGYGARIINPGSSDTPTYTANASLFNSNTSSLLSYDATIVAATLKHDQTNYSTGYLPVGPNLSSGRTGAQYFTFKFARASVSKFDIRFTGNVAGVYVALPGSAIDTAASATNGWVDMSVGYISGTPSVGCATGGTITLNSSGTQSKTCTFGPINSSDSGASGEIYIRIKLTAGQTVTALAILGASN